MVPAMANNSDWKEMKRHAFEAFRNDGRLSVSELESLVEIGCFDGEFDDLEKLQLINIISNLTRADVNDAMWAKIDELIHRFELGHDSEAKIEHLDDEEVAPDDL